jgi:predicted metal-dependent phosphoesterase TrpH
VKLPRAISAAFVLLGLLIGTWSETMPRPTARRSAAGDWILAADFHVHAFPGDGALPPWAVRHEAARAGLDAFTISNHNRVSTGRLARWMSLQSEGPIVIVGQEVTARSFHVIAAGIEERVSWETSPADVVRAVHEQGGVAIAAHPVRRFWPAWDDEALGILDGYERAHPVIDQREKTRAELASFDGRVRARRPHIAAIGSSDFHWTGSIGWCRTYVLARERSAAGVIEAVRAGRTVAADRQGHLYGDPALVSAVENAGGFIPPPAERSRFLSMGLAWLGLLGMVVLE